MNTDDAVYYNYKAHDDDFYALTDDQRKRRGLRRLDDEAIAPLLDASHSLTARETLEVRENGMNECDCIVYFAPDINEI